MDMSVKIITLPLYYNVEAIGWNLLNCSLEDLYSDAY